MKVASIVLNHFTSDSRVLKEGISLAAAGYTVTVVALHDPGLPEREKVEGIRVHRVRLASRRLPKNLFFHAVRYLELLVRIWIYYRKHDVFHCHDLNALPLGYCCRLFRKKAKLVYDAHEFETERSYRRSGLRYRAEVALERFLVKRCDAVITVSGGIAAEYARRYGIPEPALIMNCPPYRDVAKEDIFRKQFGLNEETTIFLYQGLLDTGRGIDVMIRAFSSREGDDRVLVLMGYGPLEEMVRSAAVGSPAVFFQPAVPFREMASYTASADWGMVFIEDVSPSYYYSLPNKLFEFMMAGVPVIATPLHEISGLVNACQAGIVLEDFSAATLGLAVNRLDRPQTSKYQAGIERVRQKYNWEKQEDVLVSLYRDLQGSE